MLVRQEKILCSCGKLHSFVLFSRNVVTKCKCGNVFFTKFNHDSIITERDIKKMKHAVKSKK